MQRPCLAVTWAVFVRLVLLVSVCDCEPVEEEVSARRSLVWGPGLRAEVVLPVRYFYIQAVSNTGENITSSPGSNIFIVTVKVLNSREHVRRYVPTPSDRNDGTFLMRYRLYGSAIEGLNIEVFHRGQHVGQSPFILKGPVYHEYCYCPEEEPEKWKATVSCPAKEEQISSDFVNFPSIDLSLLLEEVPNRFGDRGIVHYTILNNQIYRRTMGRYTDFKMFSDEMLLSLARKVHLPDVEFYVNVGDWPLETRKTKDNPLPIISWCGSDDTADIVLPTYDITRSTLETLRGVTNDLLSIQGQTVKLLRRGDRGS